MTAIAMASHTTRQKRMTSQRPASLEAKLPTGAGAAGGFKSLSRAGAADFRGRLKSNMSAPEKDKMHIARRGSCREANSKPGPDGSIKFTIV